MIAKHTDVILDGVEIKDVINVSTEVWVDQKNTTVIRIHGEAKLVVDTDVKNKFIIKTASQRRRDGIEEGGVW